jgi:3'-5' exoribonuclease
MRSNHEPSAAISTFADMRISDLDNGQSVDMVLLVREAELRSSRNGSHFLSLQLGDRHSRVRAVQWEATEDHVAAAKAGKVIRLRGVFNVDQRYGPQIRLTNFRVARAEEYDADELRDGPTLPVPQMEADLRELISTVQNPHLRALLEALLGERSKTWHRYRTQPAAKYYHQAYVHGLLEHSLTVAQSVSAISATFPGIDRDIAVTGALLHDIGKLQAYAVEGDGAIDLSDAGKLQGEIPLGYYLVRRMIEDLPGFPPQTAEAVLHIILSHHGQLEHGSPVVPCTREATLVHMIDNLGGRLGSFDRLEKELPEGQAWSSFDRAIGGGAYFGGRDEQDRAAA